MIPVSYSARYVADLGQHVMPIRKFDLVAEALGDEVDLTEPEPATDADLLRVHTPAYVEAVRTGEPRALAESQKFPWSPGLAEAVRWTNGGCINAARTALKAGNAGNLASGFHHAHADHGEGFCTFNGLVVAAERLRAEGLLRRVLVLDLDLHYGNGTASLLSSRPWMYQLSVYGSFYKENRPSNDVGAERAADTANAWSVPVANGSDGGVYLRTLAWHMPKALDRALPDLVMYQAGADPLRDDPYSPLDVGADDLAARDAMVFRECERRGIPVMWVLAGGYTPDVSKVVAVHVNTARAAAAR